uniref:Uncharacterized protein n=1 Tax=Avena sativa TaxID=4498 RepID=A0ACD6A8H5_AVESA
MEVDSIPGEEELAFAANQDDDDAEDVSPGSRELAAMVEAAAAESVMELDARGAAPPYGDDDDRTPRDAMEFKSYEEVLNFYKRYALRTGFGVCVKKSSFTKAGLCRRLVLVCNKWGEGKEDACYQARPTAKTNCQATVVARLWGDGLLHLTDVSLEHNHPLNPSLARFLRCYKTLPSGMSKDLVVRAARGEFSTSGDMEAPMFDDWGRLKIREGDVQAINGFFAEMQAKQTNFFYVMDFYVEGRMRSVLWADSRSREAYQYFNDAIWVDTTCLRNKFNVPLVSFLGVNHHGQLVLLGCGLLSDESTESFLWLFKSWLTCMKGRLPGAVITDECVALKTAVREVFPKTRHRISDWHIVSTMSEKLDDSVRAKLETAIYGSLKDDEFEARWKNTIERYGLQDNEWMVFLYENRHLWVPSFLKDAFWAGLSVNHRESPGAFFGDSLSQLTTLVTFLNSYTTLVQNKHKMEQQDDFESLSNNRVLVSKFPMEEQVSKLYTLNMFLKFQEELKSTMQCQVQLDGSTSSFIVIDLAAEPGGEMVNKKYEVVHCMESNRMECNCGLFQFSGIVCRHALSVLKWQQVYDIPPCYVLNRWRSDYKQLHFMDNPLKDFLSSNHVERYDQISLQCLRLVEIGMVSDEKYQHALKLISDMTRTLLDDNLCREMEQKLSPSECTVANVDSHVQPGSSEGGPAKKRRGRPPKKSKDLSVESVSNQYGNKDSLLVSSAVSQKDALHSSSTASNLGTHIRAHGVDDLMEEVDPNEVSFESPYGVQSSNSNHYGDQLQQGHTLQFAGQNMPSAEQSRGAEWLYPFQDDQVPPFGRRTS